MAVRCKPRKLHEFFEDEYKRTCRRRKAVGLVRALEEFTLAHKQRVERDLAQRTMDRLRAVQEDVERRRAARRPVHPAQHAHPANPEEKPEAENEKAEGEEALKKPTSPAISLSCVSVDSANIWCTPPKLSPEATVLPGNFRPLEDLSRDDLALIYSEESYMERRRLFKEACRKRFGRHVWTWEHLMGYEPRSLSDTCSIPPADAVECKRLSPKEVCSSKMQGLIQQVHKDLEDEEKELELKFLELEMKMNPHVAKEDLYDYQPDVIAELRDVLQGSQRAPKLNVEPTRWKRLWNPVPKATMMRAKYRTATKASSWEDSDSDTEQKRLKDLMLYDSQNKRFLPPQAMLQRAKVHERLEEDKKLTQGLNVHTRRGTKGKTPVRCSTLASSIGVGNTKTPQKIREGSGDASSNKPQAKGGFQRTSETFVAVSESNSSEVYRQNLDRGDACSDVDEMQSNVETLQTVRLGVTESQEEKNLSDARCVSVEISSLTNDSTVSVLLLPINQAETPTPSRSSPTKCSPVNQIEISTPCSSSRKESVDQLESPTSRFSPRKLPVDQLETSTSKCSFRKLSVDESETPTSRYSPRKLSPVDQPKTTTLSNSSVTISSPVGRIKTPPSTPMKCSPDAQPGTSTSEWKCSPIDQTKTRNLYISSRKYAAIGQTETYPPSRSLLTKCSAIGQTETPIPSTSSKKQSSEVTQDTSPRPRPFTAVHPDRRRQNFKSFTR